MYNSTKLYSHEMSLTWLIRMFMMRPKEKKSTKTKIEIKNREVFGLDKNKFIVFQEVTT